jgi:hypothetical protein
MHPSFQIELNSLIGRAESGASSEDLTQRRKGAKKGTVSGRQSAVKRT